MKKILIINNHPCAVEETDFTPLSTEAYLHYKKLAKDNAVRFKDDIMHIESAIMLENMGDWCEEGKLYDCPPGFEIVIESGLKDPCPQCGCTSRQQARGECTVSWCYRGQEGYLKQYATLKPLDAK